MQAAIYARISLDRDGESLGVARQLEDCRAKAKAQGWTVAHEFVDNDVSASKAKPRPEYEALLAALEAGTVGALVVYDLDRLTRKPAELESFIDLADRKSISLANVSGDVDLTTANGRMIARIKGAVARQEADRIGERVKRQKQQRAQQGKPAGSRYRTFGYTSDFQPHPTEAPMVLDAFERVAAGESVQSICNGWNAQGILTTAGGRWRRDAVARIMERPGYAGIATFNGSVVGVTDYPALIDEPLYEQAQAALTNNNAPGKNARTYLLSGIATCDLCKMPMYGNAASSGRYLCKPDIGGCGKVTMKMSWVDSAIVSRVFARFQQQAWSEHQAGPSRDFGAEVAGIDAAMQALRDANTAGDLDLADLLPLLKAQREKRAAVLREAAKAPTPMNYLLEPQEDWVAASISARRAIVARYIKAVLIKPTTAAGRRRFDASRLSILWTDGTRQDLQDVPVVRERHTS